MTTEASAKIIEKQYDEARGGWIVNASIVSTNGDTRTGMEFLALPETATDAELGATMPDVGGEVTITAKAMVTGKNARQEADGDTRASVKLQITAMELSNAPDTTNAASDLYGKK